MYPQSIRELIGAFSKLPNVGERTAERYVFWLLKSGKKNVAELTLALKNLIDNIKSCEICFDFSDGTPCTICNDKKRDHETICVVQDSQDIQIIEKTGVYHGIYHVLRGVIKYDEDSLQETKWKELLLRIKNNHIKEIILALNPDLDGETTSMFLTKKIKELQPSTKVTRLARGIPMGSDLKYADEITLSNAIKNRIS